ncbi:MAG TPA: M28 family peptidase, partial [Thermoanaerobaculia bacterium]|nr:M28 family peptidase [Thermoanaerobaculia bacterium]
VPGGSYLLPVPLIAANIDSQSATCQIVAGGKRETLAWAEGFVAGGNPLREQSEVEAPVVFVGYGVAAPELGWDDYAGLDVRGKLVLAMRGAPDRLPHDERAYYGETDTKRAAAAAHGAVGYLSVRRGGDAESWQRLSRNAGKRPSTSWLEPDGTPHGAQAALLVSAALSPFGLTALLAAAGRTPDALEAAAKEPGKGFALGAALHLAYHSTIRRLESSNVAALLPGADPALRRQVVVFSAHLDHLGEGAAVDGDAIYNGYYDNAMGCALMLETARTLATARQRPRRSLLFLAVTGEEGGLLGSEELAFHPPAGLGPLVADVNLDMPLFLYPVGDLVAYGSEHSSLQEPATRAARAAGFTLSPDPMPEELVFVRSDQYAFVERGIPAVYLMPGFRSLDPKVNGEAAFRNFLETHYHQPSDQQGLPVDWPSALRFLQANALLGREIADADAPPQWNEGDFFGRRFGTRPAAAESAPPARRIQR